jgi:hypothetical protein
MVFVHVDVDVVNGMAAYQSCCAGVCTLWRQDEVDVTSDVHLLDFNKRILILKMHGANIKIIYKYVSL